jgi:hypothetical protein
MFTNGKDIQSNLVGQLNFFHEVFDPLTGLQSLTCTFFRLHIRECVNAKFHDPICLNVSVTVRLTAVDGDGLSAYIAAVLAQKERHHFGHFPGQP